MSLQLFELHQPEDAGNNASLIESMRGLNGTVIVPTTIHASISPPFFPPLLSPLSFLPPSFPSFYIFVEHQLSTIVQSILPGLENIVELNKDRFLVAEKR